MRKTRDQGAQPIATLTFAASSQIRLSLSFRKALLDSTRFSFLMTVTSSARAAESAWSPVSPEGRKTCVGTSLWTLVVKGTANTVSARS
jgi:hypothetical protein